MIFFTDLLLLQNTFTAITICGRASKDILRRASTCSRSGVEKVALHQREISPKVVHEIQSIGRPYRQRQQTQRRLLRRSKIRDALGSAMSISPYPNNTLQRRSKRDASVFSGVRRER